MELEALWRADPRAISCEIVLDDEIGVRNDAVVAHDTSLGVRFPDTL